MTADLFRVLRLWLERSGWLVVGIFVTVISALAGVALLAFAGKLVAASVGGAESAALAAAGVIALLWLRPLILLRPIMRYLERLATHEATFRALADMRVWFSGASLNVCQPGLACVAPGICSGAWWRMWKRLMGFICARWCRRRLPLLWCWRLR